MKTGEIKLGKRLAQFRGNRSANVVIEKFPGYEFSAGPLFKAGSQDIVPIQVPGKSEKGLGAGVVAVML